jgi:hypothetical protein
MPRPSKIDRLPPEIREQIGRLRESGRTIDEILAALKALGVADVSRSGLGRHVQEIDALGEQLRTSRAVADALVTKLGDAPEGRQARLNIELLHAMIMKLFISGQSGEMAQVDPETAMLISTALRNLASAAKSDADLTARLRKEAEAKAAAEMKAKLAELEKDGSSARSTGSRDDADRPNTHWRVPPAAASAAVSAAMGERPQPLQDRPLGAPNRQDVHHHARGGRRLLRGPARWPAMPMGHSVPRRASVEGGDRGGREAACARLQPRDRVD